MNLDPRQRAMLMEMGVQVWQPVTPSGKQPSTAKVAAKQTGVASDQSGSGKNFQEVKAIAAVLAPAAAGPTQGTAPPPSTPAPAAPAQADSAQAGWRLGPSQQLYADTAQAGGARWLVLAQAAPSALQAPAFEGDAGRLLDNMLRAARLHQDARAVVFAPLVRQTISGAMDAFFTALSALMAQAQPDVVLVMGRLAAQALLASSAPFGKLRAEPHAFEGRTLVVTHDAPYLLRCPHDKAKAWDDLCLAMRLAAS